MQRTHLTRGTNVAEHISEIKRETAATVGRILARSDAPDVVRQMAEEIAALRLSRDLAREQLAVTIAERDAERALSDALAEALRSVTVGHTCDREYDAAHDALYRYDIARNDAAKMAEERGRLDAARGAK